jgi:hypothetical protein
MAIINEPRVIGLELYRRLAAISVARACGFAALGTLCVMVGLASEVANSLKAGGYCALLTTIVLLIKARQAPTRPIKRSELWVMLDKPERPPEHVAQAMLGGVLQSAFLRFASIHALAACIMLSLALVANIIGHIAGG